ncbi:common central domain of tyrosinase-domain-containing protein [Lophiotrema nucula]|uniref:tyrosinase n=1 Tax=Lophiotrema nucula TaxID=690887 RepID=A0A6A5Z3S0_9PLEO|nr:common central domain of tyrosinase-domain-containing protein [Lophiotrema nucula]
MERKPEYQELWTLYILAVERLKAVYQQEKTSYYQVAGIHGQPWIPWDNVPSWSDEPTWGYCPHNGILFAPWHRPYILTYEQLLHQHVLDIVNEISDPDTKTRYREAATKFRIPYWDWAENPPEGEHVLPSSVYGETLHITFPNGTVATVANPLFEYRFHPLIPEDFSTDGSSPYNLWNKTYRLPLPYDSPNPVDSIPDALARIDGNLGSARSGLFSLFKTWQAFNRFSNQSPGYNPQIGNLETVHGNIHSAFLWGHMWFATIAAYDPVFWLHHANVDRQIALWQAVYPDSYVEPERSVRETTFTINSDWEVGPDSDLTPFHRNSEGAFWTPALVRDVERLGYTYPELQDRPSNETLKMRIRDLYDDSASARLVVRQGGAQDKTSRDWKALIELPTGYSASVFLGEAGSDPVNWPAEENYVGSFSTTFNIGMGSETDVLNGLVGLTANIAKAHESGMLGSVEEDSVVDYLKANLKWKVASAEGKVVASSEIAKFKIGVFSHLQTVPQSASEFPSIISTKEYPEITGA